MAQRPRHEVLGVGTNESCSDLSGDAVQFFLLAQHAEADFEHVAALDLLHDDADLLQAAFWLAQQVVESMAPGLAALVFWLQPTNMAAPSAAVRASIFMSLHLGRGR